MPSAAAESQGISAVAPVGAFLDDLLSRAASLKPTASVDPPLKDSDFKDLQSQLGEVLGPELTEDGNDAKKVHRFAVIETAVRATFSDLIATTSIDSPDFVRVWNLFDILSILSDTEQCDPALLFWLVEELLDSQTIAGCRKVFDFLESRRERITAKHFKQKQLVILRTCNELLRRLSRALDPAFCGRVFIFMFQSFPLGDKSSVNLRGEYHVENVTTYDREQPQLPSDKMDVDTDSSTQQKSFINDRKISPRPGVADSKKQQQQQQPEKQPLDPDALYPIFWSLQESFSQPKRLFEPNNFADFKSALESTVAVFKTIKPDTRTSKDKQEKQTEESKARVMKRKRSSGGESEDELANGFNPKYLTSRDLFKLEISDLAFRRNVLVQALIIIDFLLSLSAKAKEKIAGINPANKSVTYSDQLLSEDDTKWTMDMKKAIAEYLKLGTEGPYFYRMVETVLSRDKNWVRWKIENCPSIELPPLLPEIFQQARAVAGKAATNKRLRATPMGSLRLDFLSDDGDDRLDEFKDRGRYAYPELETFRRGIADDDFEIDMPSSNASRRAAVEGKASKTWRALRIAGRHKLAVFDKIQDDERIDVIFEPVKDEDEEAEMEGEGGKGGGQGGEDGEGDGGDVVMPGDKRPIVMVGTDNNNNNNNSSSNLVGELLGKHKGTFRRVPQHTTRKMEDGETDGKEYHFVDALKFGMMRDGDQFLAFTEVEGEPDKSRGTSRRVVEGILESGKVAVMILDHEGAQQVKDNGFDARFVLLLKSSSSDSLAAVPEDTSLYESVIEGEDLSSLESAIFGGSALLPKAEEEERSGSEVKSVDANEDKEGIADDDAGKKNEGGEKEEEEEDVAMADATATATATANKSGGEDGCLIS
ncbi:THO complex subunit 1 transcription elongation factor-domain-containing protein [Diplogelasinospora grovesii]|uniref:THO complex subunit 1 transcription elongation factor-domain-containing protein n=1 Tax=Diplogelasinospora grovesii TaxID=303347 RepID=A0AAN6S8C6_9PEZI|nr:THO complex subunit 1 transcription elongation factor-domain-containing protein [Diplogelasinospora grovesii]